MQIVDALATHAEEGRTRRRNSPGSCQEALIRRCPNGETRPRLFWVIRGFCHGRVRAELKYLSTRWKRHRKRFPE
ncbi:MAG TPA: hypothetical protein DIU47_01405 [Candidatus Pacebacteria bacterium]|nr:hypothetical protein [Candidatus Paceibacterota bacterium]